jgi:hypothetical protein
LQLARLRRRSFAKVGRRSAEFGFRPNSERRRNLNSGVEQCFSAVADRLELTEFLVIAKGWDRRADLLERIMQIVSICSVTSAGSTAPSSAPM